MAQIVLHDIDAETLSDLSRLADQNELSLEDQATGILRDGIRRRTRLERADRIAAMTPKGVLQSNSTDLIREDRDR